MARATDNTVTPPTPTSSATAPLGARAVFAQYGRRWTTALTHLIPAAVQLDQSGEWALDGSPTCAHWIAATLDIDVGTAREWLRIGRELAALPETSAAFVTGELSYTKARTLTRLATAANERELLDLAARTPAGDLGRALAAWSARHEDERERERRHRRDRGLRWRTEPDGMVTCSIRMTPEQAATFTAAIDAHVVRSDGRNTDHQPEPPNDTTERGIDASATRGSHPAWWSLAQQRVDALIDLLANGGTNIATEVILHVRGDGCTLDDGTPIADTVVERIADTASLRAMIHDAESHPINVSGKHRHHTKRQKLVVKERDRRCVDCGGTDFLEYDHVPDFDISRRTLVEETELRCSRCHARRHRNEGRQDGPR